MSVFPRFSTERASREGKGRGVRVFLPFSRRACNGTKVATLRHVHSVLRIHAWHYVCARLQRAADGPLDAPFLFESSTTSLVRAPCAAAIPNASDIGINGGHNG